jgi:hypothetical protein
MATINARGCRALVTLDTERPDPCGEQPGDILRERFVIRSDGKVLHRLVGYGQPGALHRPSTGFAIKGSISKPENRTAEWLTGFVTRQGRTVIA